MLIDIHGHIGQGGGTSSTPGRVSTYAGVTGTDLVLVANSDAVSHTPGAPNLDEADANLGCLSACRAHDHIGPVYWVRAGRPDSHPYAVAGALASDPFAGVLFAPSLNGYSASDRLLDPYMTVVARFGMPALFWFDSSKGATPQDILVVARRHPKVPIILCHRSGPECPHADAVDAVCAAARDRDADLYLDTAHLAPDAVRLTIQTCGADRVLYGTDAVSMGDAHIPRHITLLDNLRDTLTVAQYEQLTGGNARHLFGARLEGLV